MEVPRRLCTGPALTSLVGRLAARIALLPQHAVARDLHLQPLGQRVDHRTADAVQAAGRRIDLAAELAARMQGGEDHFQRAEILEFRMRIDRDAAAVVAHGQPVVRLQRHLDEAGMAGDRLVHCVVEHFGGQVVQRRLVGAADIHAGPAADRLQPLQDLDVLGGVVATLLPWLPPNRSFMLCSRISRRHPTRSGESGQRLTIVGSPGPKPRRPSPDVVLR